MKNLNVGEITDKYILELENRIAGAKELYDRLVQAALVEQMGETKDAAGKTSG